MSSISYRDWEIWINKSYFDSQQVLNGYFRLNLVPAIMLDQTLEFFGDLVEEVRRGDFKIDNQVKNYLNPTFSSSDSDSPLTIRKFEQLDTSKDLSEIISRLLNELSALSACADFSFNCHHIEYVILPFLQKVFVALREPFSRGVGFQIKERGATRVKLSKDFGHFLGLTDEKKAAMKHYLTGLTLLNLEDSNPGLIDAAFMQFYQSCEILLGPGSPTVNVGVAMKAIAKDDRLSDDEKKALQIIIYHIWAVRNEYFGHGNARNNINSNEDSNHAHRIARQVLVVRWLCRRLLDLDAPSNTFLAREIGMFHGGGYYTFSGDYHELEKAFRIDYSKNKIREIKTWRIDYKDEMVDDVRVSLG